MILNEKLQIIIEFHPFYQSLNKRIMEEYLGIGFPNTNKTNVKAKMSHWNLGDLDMPSVHDVGVWAINLVQSNWVSCRHGMTMRDICIASYDNEDYAIKHDHIPTCFSFVYYVKCPRGSSPLIFSTSGKRIKAEEGKMVLFPSVMKHEVPRNNCEDRIVIAGNIEPVNKNIGKKFLSTDITELKW